MIHRKLGKEINYTRARVRASMDTKLAQMFSDIRTSERMVVNDELSRALKKNRLELIKQFPVGLSVRAGNKFGIVFEHTEKGSVGVRFRTGLIVHYAPEALKKV